MNNEKDKLICDLKDRISELKELLSKSDYKVIKWTEGNLDNKEFDKIKVQRQQIRDKINELENQLNVLSTE